jgi:hypothetical protein
VIKDEAKKAKRLLDLIFTVLIAARAIQRELRSASNAVEIYQKAPCVKQVKLLGHIPLAYQQRLNARAVAPKIRIQLSRALLVGPAWHKNLLHRPQSPRRLLHPRKHPYGYLLQLLLRSLSVVG